MTKKTRQLKLKKLTPLSIVEAIEPALPFWTGALGFTKTVEVPHGDRLGFVILMRDGIEVMLQTRASLAQDLPGVSALGVGHLLYADVASLDEAIAAMPGVEVVVPRRKTFYGAEEIWVRDPAGGVVGLAEMPG